MLKEGVCSATTLAPQAKPAQSDCVSWKTRLSDGGRRGEKRQEGIQRKMSESQVVHYMLCCNTGICAPSDLSPLTVKQPVPCVTAKPTTLPCTHPRLLRTTLCCPLCYRRRRWIYYLPPWTFCCILVLNVSSAHMQGIPAQQKPKLQATPAALFQTLFPVLGSVWCQRELM